MKKWQKIISVAALTTTGVAIIAGTALFTAGTFGIGPLAVAGTAAVAYASVSIATTALASAAIGGTIGLGFLEASRAVSNAKTEHASSPEARLSEHYQKIPTQKELKKIAKQAITPEEKKIKQLKSELKNPFNIFKRKKLKEELNQLKTLIKNRKKSLNPDAPENYKLRNAKSTNTRYNNYGLKTSNSQYEKGDIEEDHYTEMSTPEDSQYKEAPEYEMLELKSEGEADNIIETLQSDAMANKSKFDKSQDSTKEAAKEAASKAKSKVVRNSSKTKTPPLLAKKTPKRTSSRVK